MPWGGGRGSGYRGNPGNAGGGKGPQFKTDETSGEAFWRLGNLSTPKTVQKLQTALHAKAKADSRLSLLWCCTTKISREDILTYAFARCRFNKGAPGIDGQDFADIETYGVELWLGELALALRACPLPTGPNQKSVHTEGQRQTQAAEHLDLAGIGSA